MHRPHSPLLNSYAWLVVWVLLSVAAGFSAALVDSVGPWFAVLVFAGVGVGLGLLWYRLYPRPFGERMRAIGKVVVALIAFSLVLVAIVGLIALVGWLAGMDGASISAEFDGSFRRPDPEEAIYLGVVVGLYLAGRRDPNAPFALNSVRPDVRAATLGDSDASTSLAGTRTAVRTDRAAGDDGDR